MRCTPSLPSIPGPFVSGIVAADRVISLDQIEINYVVMLN